jgi:hypothetical protein
MCFTGLCFGAFICLVFLVDGLPSLLFYILGFSSSFLFQLFEKKCWCGATTVEQLVSMRDPELEPRPNSRTGTTIFEKYFFWGKKGLESELVGN